METGKEEIQGEVEFAEKTTTHNPPSSHLLRSPLARAASSVFLADPTGTYSPSQTYSTTADRP
jgi:hypothetical protein